MNIIYPYEKGRASVQLSVGAWYCVEDTVNKKRVLMTEHILLVMSIQILFISEFSSHLDDLMVQLY